MSSRSFVDDIKVRVRALLITSGIAYGILLCLVFFLICFGLGYATLSRYDPRLAPGTRDSHKYYRIVVNEPQNARDFRVQERVLVPYLAKPIYWLAKGRVKSWDPVFFALLVVNSFFCAIAALMLVVVGHRLTKDTSVALLGATLYLLNFAVANLQLSGLVDSAFACLMMAVILVMLTGRLFWLPILMILGATAKDTFLPLAVVFVVIWLVAEYRGRLKLSRVVWIIATIAVGLITTIVIQSIVFGQTFDGSWVVLFSRETFFRVFSFNFLQSLLKGIFARESLYIFGWLLPLGLWRIKDLPRPWVFASLSTSLVILLVGAARDTGNNVSRPVFNVAGAMLSLSVAVLLAKYLPSAFAQVAANPKNSVSEDSSSSN